VLPDDHQNPADWTMLQHLLPKQPKPGSVRGSHACLPYVELPAFWERLKAFGTTSAQTLQFLILTCMRSGEVLQTRWEQLDLEEVGEWLVPASVMKNGLPANVPLSSEAIELLRGIRNAQQAAGYDTTKGLVFRGQDPSKQQGQDTMLKLLKDSLGYADTTVHGFRATFKTWAGEKTSHDRDTQEYCLHHITGDAAEQAYKRGEFWDKRQACLQDWADVVTGLTPITPVKRKLQRKAPALSLVA
jgi:integrase